MRSRNLHQADPAAGTCPTPFQKLNWGFTVQVGTEDNHNSMTIL